MSISRVGTATGATTCTVPTHSIGDLILINAFRSGSVTAPTTGAGYTLVTNNASANLCRSALGYKIATATNDASGTWTNATGLTCVVYTSTQVAAGGSIMIGGFGISSGATNTITFNTVTMGHQDGSSWVAGFAGHRSTNQSLSTHAPAGMTFITSSDLTNTAEVCAFDTNAGVSSWTSTNVTVTGTASGWDTQTIEVLEVAPSTGISNFVQHYVTEATPQSAANEPGNNYQFMLPNTTLSHNAILAVFSYPTVGNGGTLAGTPLTDNAGNTWPTTPTASVTGASEVLAAFLLTNANAFDTLTLKFAAATYPVKCWITELYNVTAFDSSSGATAVATANSPALLSCGSFTPAHNNCLILSYFSPDAQTPGTAISSFIKDGGATLNDANIAGGPGWPSASQMVSQGTAAAIRPAMQGVHAGTTDAFNCLAIALQTGSQGTPKPTTGIHVDRICVYNNLTNPASWILAVPSTGNLGCLGIWGGTAATDSDGHAWTVSNLVNNRFMYRVNYAANDARTLTVTVPTTGFSAFWFDISNAATSPFDTEVDLGQVSFGNATTLADQPDLTPSTANGLVIALTTNGTGPTPGTTAPSGARYDFPLYANLGDSGYMSLGNGLAHYYNPDTSPINWTWDNAYCTVTSGTYNSSTGQVVLNLTTPLSPDTTVAWGSINFTGSGIRVWSLTGTGSVASLDGTFTTTATTANSVTYTAATGLGAITITGGSISPDGGSKPTAIAFKAAPAPPPTVTLILGGNRGFTRIQL